MLQEMALYGLCFTPSNHALFLRSHKPISQPLKAAGLRPKSSVCSSSDSQRSQTFDIDCTVLKDGLLKPIALNKRTLNLSILALILSARLSSFYKAEAEESELERYTDYKEGFTLLMPSSWIKVDKAGATVLFEEPNRGTNNVGVVVSPVRVKSLNEFGSPQFVADKLIQAEKRKESTKEVEVISVSERYGQGGIQVYEIEYKVDSTRGGMERIFSAAFVASKKLYLLNISHSDKPENPIDVNRRMVLENVLHSFDASPAATPLS